MKKVIASAAALLLSTSVFAADGKAVYEKACQVCHAAGVAGAPVAHDAAAWSARTAQGMDAMLASVKAGKGAMPAGGMCGDCSDDDYKAAIDFMSK
ncbi:c-type cytochrome [Aestuariirhabdus sp. LZHN29]|uniref:c-type cytochrome n=1 Tax=Aestuariirhabdus sp. LZHN29 TaxID=3417462 RepID=UPI003CF9D359